MQRFLDAYWVLYFVGYVLAIAGLGWSHWDGLEERDNRIYLLAAVFGVAAGAASAVAIIVEVGGRMVLLIPAAVKKLKEQGRREERAEWEAWLRRRNEAEANNRPLRRAAAVPTEIGNSGSRCAPAYRPSRGQLTPGPQVSPNSARRTNCPVMDRASCNAR